MAEYAFFSVWTLAAPIEDVWDATSQPDGYPEWWPYVARVEQLRAGDANHIGAVYRTHWETALPYGFSFDATTTRSERLRLLELNSTGELAGNGRWELSEEDGTTTVRYYWDVRTTKPWMDWLAPAARPLFAWNHAVVMDAGAEGLARQLGCRLIDVQSYTGESTRVLTPALTMAGLIALPLLVARQARRLLP